MSATDTTTAAATWWHRRHHDEAPSVVALEADPRWHAGTECMAERPTGHPEIAYECTRGVGHRGRHIATGDDGRAYAAWPGTHEPTLDDLDDPLATTATLALTLPDGWEPREANYYRWLPGTEDMHALYADVADIEFGDMRLSPERALEYAARLVEAAGIVEQLRAGAR